jgi:hypothetical protein
MGRSAKLALQRVQLDDLRGAMIPQDPQTGIKMACIAKANLLPAGARASRDFW